MAEQNTQTHENITVAQAIQLGIQYHQAGHLDAAVQMYQAVLDSFPEDPHALHLLGVVRDQQGKPDEAIALICKSLAAHPDHAEAQNNLGLAYFGKGDPLRALACFDEALRLNAQYAEAHYNRAQTLKALLRSDEAIEEYKMAIAVAPHYAEAHFNLGNLYRDSHKLELAQESYAAATTLRPQFAEAHNNAGILHLHAKAFDKAIQSFRQAVTIKPEYAQAWSNLGNALQETGQTDEAALCFHKSLTLLDPENSDARSNLADSLRAQGKPELALIEYQRAIVLKDPGNLASHIGLGEALATIKDYAGAEQCFRKALELDPDNAFLYNCIGSMLYKLQRFEEGVECYKKAVELQPDYAAAHFNLAVAYEDQGSLDEAMKYYKSAAAITPNACVELQVVTMMNPLAPSRDYITQYRDRLNVELPKLLAREDLRIENPFSEQGQSNFFLAYQGVNDRWAQEKIAEFYLKNCPALAWEAPHIAQFRAQKVKQKIRVGVLSAFLYRNHTMMKFVRGIIEHLPRDQTEVVVFHMPGNVDEAAKAMNVLADHSVVLTQHLPRAREQIAAEKLDVMFYPDIGMDTFTLFLPFARLAPVQCVTWGHPDTTGIPNMDYFISTRGMEPEGAQEHYSEQLIELEELPTYYYRPEFPERAALRAYYTVPEDVTLYVCPQSLFKFHPDYDITLGKILERDPKAMIVMIKSNPHWMATLMERFKAVFPQHIDRIKFVPRMDFKDFLNLVKLADVVIDPMYFGGGTSSYETLAAGTPIVTWPGPFMRGRVTLACYQKMGMDDLIAQDSDHYVDLAVRVANDKVWRAELSDKIHERSSVLFERKEAVDEMARFFRAAVEAAHRGEKLTGWDPTA